MVYKPDFPSLSTLESGMPSVIEVRASELPAKFWLQGSCRHALRARCQEADRSLRFWNGRLEHAQGP